MILAVAITLFFVIDALGHLPVYLSILHRLEKKKRRVVASRELLFALAIMVGFCFLGQILLNLLQVTKTTVQISGSIILFLIAIRLVFKEDPHKEEWEEGPPLIVPIATPIIAGPSVLASIMIFAQEDPTDRIVLSAIVLAWAVSAIIFWFAEPIYKVMKDRGLSAAQRLMGLIVAFIAVQMFIEGIRGIVVK